jgi:hypothetical protein
MRDEPVRRKSAGKSIEATASLNESHSLGWVAAAFLPGILIGAVVLFGRAWMRVGQASSVEGGGAVAAAGRAFVGDREKSG